MVKSVFISSTSQDLREHRSAVKKVIERLGMRPIDMADFGSQPGDAVDVSLKEVRKANIFIGIIAHRYGYIPEGMEKSVTEQEFDEATQRRIPRLMYLVDPSYTAWPDEYIEKDEAAQAKLKQFKARIDKSLVRSLFTAPDNLAAQVASDLAKTQQKLILADRLQKAFIGAGIALIVLLLFVIAVFLASSGAKNESPKTVEERSFNVAVAGFIPESGAEAVISNEQAARLSKIFATEFQARIETVNPSLATTVGTIGVWSPDQIGGSIKGNTPEERTASARALVERLKATYEVQTHIVIYGVIRSTPQGVVIVPEFYVCEEGLREAEELLGSYHFEQVNIAHNPEDLGLANTGLIRLAQPTQILSLVVQGLAFYSSGYFEEASQAFSMAIEVDQNVEFTGPVLYVLRGNSSINLYNQSLNFENVLNAEQDFCRAVTLDERYARGYVGLGTVFYLQLLALDVDAPTALSSETYCATQIERFTMNQKMDLFDLTVATYEYASHLEAPETADIPAKVAFGLGQLYLVQADRSTPRDWSLLSLAENNFEQTIDAFKNGENLRIVELAAESHARLGLIHRWRNEWDAAIDEYRQAIELINTWALYYMNNRRQIFEIALVEIEIERHKAYGEYEDAIDLYQQLIVDTRIDDEQRCAFWTGLGDLYFETGRWGEAINGYLAALPLAVSNSQRQHLFLRLGDAYYNNKQLTEAVTAYEQGLALMSPGESYDQLSDLIENIRYEISTPDA